MIVKNANIEMSKDYLEFLDLKSNLVIEGQKSI